MSSVSNVLNAPRTLGCQPVGAQADAYSNTVAYVPGELVRYSSTVPPAPVQNYSCVANSTGNAPIVLPATAWNVALIYQIGERVSYPLTGQQYNWICISVAGSAGVPPPATPVGVSAVWEYQTTVGNVNTAFWASQRDGEPWYNSGVRYVPGDVVSYSERANNNARMYQSLIGSLDVLPTVSSAWKPLADGYVSSVVGGAGLGATVDFDTGAVSLQNTGVLAVAPFVPSEGEPPAGIAVIAGTGDSAGTSFLQNTGVLSVVAGDGVEVDAGAGVSAQQFTITNTGVLSLPVANSSLTITSQVVGVSDGKGDVLVRLKEAQLICANFPAWVNTDAYPVLGTPVSYAFGGLTGLYVNIQAVGANPSGNPEPNMTSSVWAFIGFQLMTRLPLQASEDFANRVAPVSSDTPVYLSRAPTYTSKVAPGSGLTIYDSTPGLRNTILDYVSALIEAPYVALPVYTEVEPPASESGAYIGRVLIDASCVAQVGSAPAQIIGTLADVSITGSFPVAPPEGKMWLFSALMGYA